MKNVVITGGIGTGKSYIASHLYQIMKAEKIDIDKEWHKWLLEPDVKIDIVDHFGHYILDDNSDIHRGKLSNIVFSSVDAMRSYMRVISPHVRKMMDDIRERVKSGNGPFVIEAPVGFEYIPMSDFSSEDFLFVGIFAPRDTQIKRLIYRCGIQLTQADAEKRISFQPTPMEYMHKCDLCFWNDGKPDIEAFCNCIVNKCNEG